MNITARAAPALLALLGACTALLVAPTVATATLAAHPIISAVRCGDAAMVARGLANLGERLISQGRQPNGNIIQVWSSDEGQRTWTLFITNGVRSCLLAHGRGWETLPQGDPA